MGNCLSIEASKNARGKSHIKYMVKFTIASRTGRIEPQIEDAMQAESSHAHISRDIQKFNRGIKLLDAAEEWVHVTALLDTQCQVGNWISKRLVQRLGMASLVSTSFEPPNIVDASGRPVSACGVINLNWTWYPGGTRNHECQFYVLANADHLDVIFGVEYIVSENLLQVNESAILPLLEHKKLKRGTMALIIFASDRHLVSRVSLTSLRHEGCHCYR